jgi:plasmid stabilization system protein ParE
MRYKLVLIRKSKIDIGNIYNYIATKLKNIKAAKDLNDKFKKAFEQIQEFPLSGEQFNEDFRKVLVKNYIIFYTINEKQKTISIYIILYAYMNIEKQLKPIDVPKES